jgi:hypothetical protein
MLRMAAGVEAQLEDACTFLQSIRNGGSGGKHPTKGIVPDRWRVLIGGPPCQVRGRSNSCCTCS